jgi:formimidoylglutamate deiminase
MHVSEQVAENDACVREYGSTPVELLQKEKILSSAFTAIHAIHITPAEIDMLASAKSKICACPTTERNLGDGIFSADRVMAEGISVALGSDSQAQVDPLEDARELDYHLRLEQQKRAILDQIEATALSTRLFECATTHGATSLGICGGQLTPGNVADFFTIDLNDLSIAGHPDEDLLSILVFSLNRSAIRDVVVGGKMVLSDQKHPLHEEIVSRYNDVYQKVWTNSSRVGTNR